MKKGKYNPIFKKGEKDNPGNYRTVSLTSVPIMEKILLETMLRYRKNKLAIGDSQRASLRASHA